MSKLSEIYKISLALLTDFYQLTMAYAYFKTNNFNKEAVFNLYFRKNPFNGGYTVSAGLEYLLDFIENYHFTNEDIDYLNTIKDVKGNKIFDAEFLDYLKSLKLTVDIDAVAEGTVIFPHEPIIRVKGPILQCQILETPLLNIINFQSLIATKAARICYSAKGEPVLEFGLRRAQGIDGGLAASRAAYIGGCAATSNVLAGKIFNIPVRGTHAHSWVMSYDSELESFQKYAEVMPNNCVFLVDTYNTIEGVKNAIKVGKWLKDNGYQLLGIRLDSGDLAYLSQEARKMLDEAGLSDAKIYASNDLDENIILSLKQQNACITVWGVGTKLVTAHDQPALGGVYKLVAVKEENQNWKYKVKISEQAIKISTPGILQIRRYISNDKKEYVGDLIYDTNIGINNQPIMVDPFDPTRRKNMAPYTLFEDLLIPVVKNGKVIYSKPTIEEIKSRVQSQLKMFHDGIKRFINPHTYPVGLELKLHELKTKLILKSRGFDQ